MKIVSFRDFVNESSSYAAGSFIDTAVKALEAEGFLVTVNSTPRQVKNDNLSCTLMYPKGYELLEEYGLGDKNILIFNGTSLKDFFDEIELKPLTIYKIGNVMYDGDSNNSIRFDNSEVLVERMKNLFIKEFLKQTNNLIYRPDPVARSRDKYMIVSDNLKIVNHPVSHYSAYIVPPKEVRNYQLPKNLLDLCEKMNPGFRREYEIVKKKFPQYIDLFSDSIAANASVLALLGHNLYFSPFFMGDLSYWHNSLRLTSYKDSISIFICSPSLRYIGFDEDSIEVEDGILKEWEKIRKMTPEEIDEHYKDFYARKRGSIAGKKFGL
jgi:hypothetical protein